MLHTHFSAQQRENFVGLSRWTKSMFPRKTFKINPPNWPKIVSQGNFIEQFLTSRGTLCTHNFV